MRAEILDIWAWPFVSFGKIIAFFLGLFALGFWVWMIFDCVKRRFMRENEKLAWMLVIILGSWIGAMIYYFAVRIYNPGGISGRPGRVRARQRL